uniref:Fatty-acid and retinol-binding protein 2 n=1 Tax=Aphelenchoides besseyi TaxID=269767 RepID=A0A1S5RME4_9BILA|nr:fatty-acid and retinol-binding protein 2 [Aphelenchoides besseyi]
MSSTLWFHVFVCATLIVAVRGSVIGTLLELPEEYKDIPYPDAMETIKEFTPEELKLIKEAIEKDGGQYKSDDIDVLSYIKPKDEKLYKELENIGSKVNNNVNKIRNPEANFAINELRIQFGAVNVKDHDAVVNQLNGWKKRFHELSKEGQDQIAQYFPGVAKTLKSNTRVRV